MLDRAVHDVGDGLEAAVRMIRCALRLTGRVLHSTEVVEEKERIGQVRVDPWKWTSHLEALAFERHDRVDNAEHRPYGRGEVGPLDAG